MRRLSILLAMSLVAIGCVTIVAGPAKAGPVYNFFHFNVCGHRCENGDASDDDSNDPVQAIYNSLTGGGQPERAASLNELCRNQYDKLMSKLPSTWEGRWVTTAWKDAASAPPGEQPYQGDLCKPPGGVEHLFGNALLVRDAPIVSGSPEVKYLGSADDSNEHRALICVTAKPDVAGGVETRLCSTHISNDSSLQGAQIQDVAQKVNGYTKPVVLMGDFNVGPNSNHLDRIYDRDAFGEGAAGKFGEVGQRDHCCGHSRTPCRCGEDTTENAAFEKFDYIFWAWADFDWRDGFISNAITESDHHIQRGQVEATS